MKLDSPRELPSEGPHKATITAVENLGLLPGKFGERKWICIVIRMDDQNDVNREPLILRMNYVNSRHPNSKLYNFLHGITNHAKVVDDPGFDTDELLGLRVVIEVEHRKNPLTKNTYANVSRFPETTEAGL